MPVVRQGVGVAVGERVATAWGSVLWYICNEQGGGEGLRVETGGFHDPGLELFARGVCGVTCRWGVRGERRAKQ